MGIRDIWQTWADLGQTFGRHWVDIGQTLGRHWADIGQTLERYWDIRQTLGKNSYPRSENCENRKVLSHIRI